MVNPKFYKNFTCRKCEGNIGEYWNIGQQYCIEVKHGARKKVRWEIHKGQKDPW